MISTNYGRAKKIDVDMNKYERRLWMASELRDLCLALAKAMKAHKKSSESRTEQELQPKDLNIDPFPAR